MCTASQDSKLFQPGAGLCFARGEYLDADDADHSNRCLAVLGLVHHLLRLSSVPLCVGGMATAEFRLKVVERDEVLCHRADVGPDRGRVS
eukprot:g9472.t1